MPIVPEDKVACQDVLRAAGVDSEVIERAWHNEASSRPFERDKQALMACLRVLYDQNVPANTMKRALGVNPNYCLGQMGLKASSRVVEAVDLPGERWRKVPGWPHFASDLGRVKSAQHVLLKPQSEGGKLKVYLAAGGSRTMFALECVVAAAWLKAPLKARHIVRHRNGDVNDCRIENLLVPERRPSGILATPRKRIDFPWTAADDRALRSSSSMNLAYKTSRHERWAVRKRVAALGICFETTVPKSKLLDDRDLDLLQRAVAVLEQAAVSDADINVGLAITVSGRLKAAHQPARHECIRALIDAEFPRPDIAAAMGISQSHLSRLMEDAGLETASLPEGWRTVLGPPEPLDGEVWRSAGWGYQVSNYGRILGLSGQLLKPTPRETGALAINLKRPDGAKTTCLLARLVLAAFRPDFAYSYTHTRFLNGDRTDLRIDNMARRLPTEGETDRPMESVQRRGNMAGVQTGPVSGSVPFFNDLWAEANRAVSKGLDDHVRDDLISAMVVIMIEGRAAKMSEALVIARRELNEMMGTYRERSIDAPVGGTENFSLLDMLTSDGEFYQR